MISIIKSIKESKEEYIVKDDILIKKANLADFLYSLNKNQFNIAMTSPPYYNARYYSKW